MVVVKERNPLQQFIDRYTKIVMHNSPLREETETDTVGKNALPPAFCVTDYSNHPPLDCRQVLLLPVLAVTSKNNFLANS